MVKMWRAVSRRAAHPEHRAKKIHADCVKWTIYTAYMEKGDVFHGGLDSSVRLPKNVRRAALARRAALTLASALFGFALVQVLTLAVADFIDPGLRDPEYGRKLAYLQAQRRQAPDRPLVLFLGSSRTTYGVRADALWAGRETPLAYNFGILAGGPIYELLHFRRLLAADIRPRWIVLEIHPGFLKVVPNLMVAHRPAIERCDARDMYALHNYVDHPWQDWLKWLRYRWAISYQLRAELMRRAAPGWQAPAAPDLTALDKTTPSGWVPLPWPRPDTAVRKQRAQLGCVAFSPCYQDFQVSDRTNRALREILDTCRRERIEVGLLVMPEADESRDATARLAQRKVLRYLSQLSAEYHAPVIDASNWCADEDFADGQHLLPEAGTRFARRLGREVLSGWIAAAPPVRHAVEGHADDRASAGHKQQR